MGKGIRSHALPVVKRMYSYKTETIFEINSGSDFRSGPRTGAGDGALQRVADSKRRGRN